MKHWKSKPCMTESKTALYPDSTQAKAGLTIPKEKPFENSLGMKFVTVPITGTSASGKTILFSIWETRVSDYSKFSRQSKRQLRKTGFTQGDSHPVVHVTFEDAEIFCNWLTEKERKSGKIGPADKYRLPTDHEWSCAVGIGEKEKDTESPKAKNGKIPNIYPWGEEWPPPNQSGNYWGQEPNAKPVPGRQTINGYSDGFENTAPVGSFQPNKFGLFDLNGNAWEWCSDRHDPANPKSRVLRGASWVIANQSRLLSSYRVGNSPATSSESNSFRCVLEKSSQ